MKRVLVLAEGQTEERFIKDVIQPHGHDLNFHIDATVHNTRVVKDGPNFKGGLSTFSRFEIDLRNLLKNPGADALVTTFIDYYALPADFPGMATRPPAPSLIKAQHVETALHAHFGSRTNFLPFLSLHEFEALIFSDPNVIADVLANPDSRTPLLQIRAAFPSPEEINEQPGQSPSKRILGIDKTYRKLLHGPAIARHIGLVRIRQECAHFDAWLSAIEAWAAR